LIGVHPHDAAEPFLTSGTLVVVRLALGNLALVNASVGQLAVLVVGDLERHADERSVGIGLEFLLASISQETVVLDVGGGWQVAVDSIEQGLHPLVLESRTYEH